MSLFLALGFVVLTVLALVVAIPFLFRVVVPTNEVHIVQSSKSTKSYRTGDANGNVYYKIPEFVPLLGVKSIQLPLEIFEVKLNEYEAYDLGRLPFAVDVVAFFRIEDSNIAAQRVNTIQELKEQLRSVVQGAVRTILAAVPIEEIMQERSKFGEQFTKEVYGQLKSWGVEPVKNIELMDIKDTAESKAITNIMSKKQSEIEKEARTVIANNKKDAETAEIEAKKLIQTKEQEAKEVVGLRTVEADKKVAVAEQSKIQVVAEQQKVTTEKEMEVKRERDTREAMIAKEVAKTKAEEDQLKVEIKAEADLTAKKKEAEGIKIEGEAKGSAITAELMAPVNSQLELAKGIQQYKEFQNYLVSIEAIKTHGQIGTAQAEALQKADVKVIANGSDASSTIQGVGDLVSSKGGVQLGALLEGFAQTDMGKALLEKIASTNKKEDKAG